MIEWLVIGAVVGLLVTFWDQFVDWIKRTVNRLPLAARQSLLGVVAFVERIGNQVKELVKYYSRADDQWIETVASRKVEFSDLPQDLQRKLVTGDVIDITNDLKLQLRR